MLFATFCLQHSFIRRNKYVSPRQHLVIVPQVACQLYQGKGHISFQNYQHASSFLEVKLLDSFSILYSIWKTITFQITKKCPKSDQFFIIKLNYFCWFFRFFETPLKVTRIFLCLVSHVVPSCSWLTSFIFHHLSLYMVHQAAQ